MKYHKVLTFEELSEKYSNYELFQAVFPEKIEFNKYYTSPIRNDKSAGCSFALFGDLLIFNDFSKGKTYNYISFIKALMPHLSNWELRNYICNKLNNNTPSPSIIHPQHSIKSILKDIQINKKSFTEEELLDFTFKGYIPNNELLNNAGIYSIKNIYYNKELVYENCTHSYAFVNVTFEGQYQYQLYFPRKEKNKRYRTCNNNLIPQLQYISHIDDYIIITKSNIDAFILKHVLGFNAIAILNEGLLIDDKHMRMLDRKYKNIYLLFDNDEAGREATIRYIKSFTYIKFNVLFVPFKYGKDMKDVCKEYDVNIVREIIKQIIK